MVQSKICGLTTPEAVEAAIAGGASHLGFIIFPKSPRHRSLEEHAALAAPYRGQANLVAVVVDPTDEDLEKVKQVFAPDMIQLHGHETLERVKAIQARGFSVIKALAIGSAEDVAAADAYATVSDALLLDAKPPKGSDLPGGNGVQMDWTLLAGARFAVPWFLSGGLDPDNVADALRLTAAPGVDVSSGVEKAPGLKDPDRVTAFLKAVATVS